MSTMYSIATTLALNTTEKKALATKVNQIKFSDKAHFFNAIMQCHERYEWQ
jgi:hypothetical protein